MPFCLGVLCTLLQLVLHASLQYIVISAVGGKIGPLFARLFVGMNWLYCHALTIIVVGAIFGAVLIWQVFGAAYLAFGAAFVWISMGFGAMVRELYAAFRQLQNEKAQTDSELLRVRSQWRDADARAAAESAEMNMACSQWRDRADYAITECARLRLQLITLRGQLDIAREAREECDTRARGLEDEVKALRRELGDAKQSLRDMTTRCQELDQHRDEIQAESDELLAKYALESKALRDAELAAKRSARKLQKKQTKVRELQNRVAALYQTELELTSQLREARAEAVKCKSQRDAATAACDKERDLGALLRQGLESSVSDLSGRVSALYAALTASKQEAAAAQQEAASAQQLLAAAEAQRAEERDAAGA